MRIYLCGPRQLEFWWFCCASMSLAFVINSWKINFTYLNYTFILWARMGEKILKLNYAGKSVNIVIKDIDQCLLMDVLNDMVTEFEKKGLQLPEFPGLHYLFNLKPNYLTDDKTLMDMFELIKTKRIDVWIDALSEPNFIWNLAQKVKANTCIQKSPPKKLDKLPIRRPKPNSGQGTVSLTSPNLSPNKSPNCPPIFNSPRRSPRFGEVAAVDEQNWNNALCSPNQQSKPSNNTNVSVPTSQPKNTTPSLHSYPKPPFSHSIPKAGSSSHSTHPKKAAPPPPSQRKLNTQGSYSNTPIDKPLTGAALKTNKKSMRPNPFPHGRKMPRSTAIMKGLYKGKYLAPQQHIAVSNEQGGPCLRKRAVSSLEELDLDSVAVNESDDGTDSEGGSDDSCSEDELYTPSHNDEAGEDNDDDDMEYDEGDIEELLNHNYVDGNWEPFKTNEWIADHSGNLTKVYDNGEPYVDADIGIIRLKEWQLFVDKEHMKMALRDYCIQEGFDVIVQRCNSSRYTAVCADIRCDWKLHASLLVDGHTWAIKKMGKSHSCDLNLVDNSMATADWASIKLYEDVKANPDIGEKSLNALLWERYGITMASSTLYRGKKQALELILGGHDESYTNLPKYCEVLKNSNPGSVAFCTWRLLEEPQRSLQLTGIFVSFAGQFKGLVSGCRGLVGVDGTHLKGNFGGVLLSAVGLDGNNEIFPVAVAVVDSENKNSWWWFFDQLKKLLIQDGREDWTIMSDRQKGIDPSLDQVWPEVSRRYYGRRLCKNFKTEYPGLLMHKLFWTVINSYSEYVFRRSLQEVQKHAGLGALKWFKELGPMDRWARFKFDSSLCCDENTNNFVESFNNTIGADRSSPVLTMLEGVRRIAMVRHATRQQLAEKWPEDGVCPNIVQQIRVLRKDSRVCQAYPSGRGTFEVHDGRARLPVSLNAKTCACGRWQLSGIPCKHAIKAILSDGKDPLHFVSEWFKVSSYKQAYSGNISPVPDEDQWPHIDGIPVLVPPVMKRSIGRPSRNRNREEGEQRKGKRSNTVRCSKCKAFGHNALTCKGGLTAKEIAELQGRPVQQKGLPGRKSKKQKVNSGEADFSFIEGTCDTNASVSTPNNTVTDEPSAIAADTARKAKKGKRKVSGGDVDEGASMIDQMVTQSQPQIRQRVTRQRAQVSMTQPPNIILARMSMLD